MSEYQYYEFQAIDRRLTAGEMSELRSFSTRARITPAQVRLRVTAEGQAFDFWREVRG